jgi:hypothetical protein
MFLGLRAAGETKNEGEKNEKNAFQAGSILGMLVVGPLVGALRARSLAGLKSGALKVFPLTILLVHSGYR